MKNYISLQNLIFPYSGSTFNFKQSYMRLILLFTGLSLFFSCQTDLQSPVPSGNYTLVDTLIKFKEKKFSIYPDCFGEKETEGVYVGEGCGDSFLYMELPEGVLTVNISSKNVFIGEECREIDLNNVEVNLEIYPTDKTYKDSIRSVDYCSCFSFSNAQKRIPLKAISGKIVASARKKEVEFTSDLVFNGTNERICVRLTDLEFVNPISKDTIDLEEVVFYNIHVGWWAG